MKDLLLSLVVVFLLFSLPVTKALGQVTITRTSSNVFYTDTSGDSLTAAYAAYQIQNTGATNYTQLWVEISNFAGGFITLAPNETNKIKLDTLATTETKTAFFYLRSSGETTTPQTHTVKVYEGPPATGTLLQSTGFSLTSSEETISALANKVNTVVTGPNPPGLGGTVEITVTGQTGTIGNAKILSFTPSSYAYWPADAYELFSTTITLSGGNTGVYTDELFFIPPNKAATDYTAVYRFRAVGVTDAPSVVSPVGFISSGTQIKHTDTGTFGTLAPIQPADNKTLVLSKTASPSTLSAGGTVTYTVSFQNTDVINVKLDELVDTLPSSPATPTYVIGSSTVDGAPYDDPIIVGTVLTWPNGIDLTPGSTRTLSYDLSIPNIEGTYDNNAVAYIGNEQIDTTLDTSDDAPATNSLTLTFAAADLSLAISVDDPAPITGSYVTYTLTLTNDGPDPATGIDVSSPLPDSLIFVSANPGQGSYDEITGLWDVGSLAASGVITLEITVLVEGTTDPIEVSAEVVSSDQQDPDSTPANDSTTEDDDASQTVNPAPPANGDLCYLVADSGDTLTRVIRTTGYETSLGATGTSLMEAIAYWPGTDELFAADSDELGVLNRTTGAFSPRANPFGTGGGSEGEIDLNDVDGLAFDPFTGILYGTHRRDPGNDLLFQINTATGAHLPDAFGAGIDYVPITTTEVVAIGDIDDLAIDADDGQMYGIANGGGSDDRLVAIDKATGAVTDVGALAQNDMEGLAYDAFGQLYGTTGTGGGTHANSYFTVDESTGLATVVAALSVGSDYESVGCLTDGVNTINGATFFDADANGLFDGTDTGTTGVTVSLYRDTDGNGTGDVFLAALDTDGNGDYSFVIAAEGDFVVTVDTGDFPGDATMSTATALPVSFADFGNTDADNDFGHTRPIDLGLTMTVDDPAPEEDTNVTFTLTLTNLGPVDATGVDVTNLLPAGLVFVSANPEQGTYDDGTGVWTVGTVGVGEVLTLEITVTATGTVAIVNTAEVTAADQPDTDSTPDNDVPSEDDQDEETVTPTEASGGGDGGLESDGSMARTLAGMLFQRRLALQARGGETLRPPPFLRPTTAAKGQLSLTDLVPTRGPQQSLPHVVSPTDLLPVTNATEVFAVDYLRDDDRRLAVLFGTTTAPGEIYEHTKVVCDRLRGATLESVRHVEIDGHPFILSRLRHEDGSIDHTISFSVYPGPGVYRLDSRFRHDEYRPPADGEAVLNLQVWSLSKTYTVDLVRDVLGMLAERGSVTFDNTWDDAPELPQVYIRRGQYAQGRLSLDVYNAAGAGTLRLTGGTLARTESGERSFFEREIPLPASTDETSVVTVELPVGPVFDAAFFVETDAGDGMDQLYLADGPWSMSADPDGARLDDFTVEGEGVGEGDAALVAPGQWRVERNARLTGEVETWAVLFRYLQSSGRPLDLSGYRYLEFTASGEGQVRLLLEKATITDAAHFGAVFRLTDTPRRHRLWFRDLRRPDGTGTFTAEDLVSLSFYLVGNQAHRKPFELAVTDVHFGGAAGDVSAETPDAFALTPNYPNPFNPTTTLGFDLPEAGPVRLVVYDLLGRAVATLADGPHAAGRHEAHFDARGLASGMYLARLTAGGRTFTRTMVLTK